MTIKSAPPAALIASILAWVLGSKVDGNTLQLLGQLCTAVFAALTAAVHAPAVKQHVSNVRHNTPHGKPRKPVKVRPLGRPFQMFDSIELDAIPRNARAVAGYVGGYWPTFRQLSSLWPRAFRLSIAVNAGEDATCLDIETGDARVGDIGPWVARQIERGVYRPVLYFSVSLFPVVRAELRAHGIHPQGVRFWTAHYGAGEHICGPHTCGAGWSADATQWTDKSGGRNLDESLCSTAFAAQGPMDSRNARGPAR